MAQTVGDKMKLTYQYAFKRNKNKTGDKLSKKTVRNARLFVIFGNLLTGGLINIPWAIYLKSKEGNKEKKTVLMNKVRQAAEFLAPKYGMTREYCAAKMLIELELKTQDDFYWDKLGNEQTNREGWESFCETEGFDELMSRLIKK